MQDEKGNVSGIIMKSVNGILKNFSMAFVANLISVATSLIVTFLIPKFISDVQYGYWQLYLFYTTYVGIFHFGLNDGIYLRYGGKKYHDLDFSTMHAAFNILAVTEFVIGIGICIGTICFAPKNAEIFRYIGLCMVLTNIRYYFIYLLQATNRIPDFATVTVVDKIIFVLLVMLSIFMHTKSFRYVVCADLVGRVISLGVAGWMCRDVILAKSGSFARGIAECFADLSVGAKLMFANLASSCIIGIIRWGISNTWDIAVFGKISLMLSISNFFITFINSVGIVVFPFLINIEESEKKKIFAYSESLINEIFFLSLILYYPLIWLITYWLPKYVETIKYVAILFPIFIFEGKMSILYNTYLKALRLERAMFNINILFLGISVILTWMTTGLMRNLDLTVGSILLLLVGRCFFNEVFLSKKMNVSPWGDIIFQTLTVAIFIWAATTLGSLMGIAVCLAVAGVYAMINHQKFHAAIAYVRN